MATSSRALSEEIDRLLEHYLTLLHQYDALRSDLSTLQSSIQQDIARANFDAPRGVRYGRDLYDQRVQAARLCRVTARPETGAAVFEIATVGRRDSDRGQGTEGGLQDGVLDGEEKRTDVPKEDAGVQPGKADVDGEAPEEEDAQAARASRSRDPIRMFGILTPRALRRAQGGAVKMVEDIVPRLVSLDAEMKEVEIQVRRARKHRAKAEALEKAGGRGVVGESRREGVVS